jgi:hypothetical protein
MKTLLLLAGLAGLMGCASGPTDYTRSDGTKTSTTGMEVLHDSDYSLQLTGGGVGNTILPIPVYTGRDAAGNALYTMSEATLAPGSKMSVRIKPQGTKSVSLWTGFKLFSQGLDVAGDAISDGIDAVTE